MADFAAPPAGEEDTESDSGSDAGDVQLGFAVKAAGPLLFEDPDEDAWDGGVAGGAPVWLAGAPDWLADAETCPCGRARRFVCQVYAPRDEPEEAYHRCVYVFCCPGCAADGSGAVAYRDQAPRDRPPPRDDGGVADAAPSSPFARHEIVVEAEPGEDDDFAAAAAAASVDTTPEPAAAELELRSAADPSVVDFLARAARAPSQVLRYGGKPLWHGRAGRAPPAPACACGSPRTFEFQVMPQLLHYLGVEGLADADALDFALVAVYTCAASCAMSRREVAHLQPAASLRAPAPAEEAPG